MSNDGQIIKWGPHDEELFVPDYYNKPFKFGTKVVHRTSGEVGIVVGVNINQPKGGWDGTYKISYGFDGFATSVPTIAIEELV